jgi:hypothetical protein
MFNRDFMQGFAVGVGVTLAVSLVAVTLVAGRRPVTRALTRGGGMLVDKAREAAAEAGEIIEDLIAEMRVEQGEEVYGADAGHGPSIDAGAEDDHDGSSRSTN